MPASDDARAPVAVAAAAPRPDVAPRSPPSAARSVAVRLLSDPPPFQAWWPRSHGIVLSMLVAFRPSLPRRGTPPGAWRGMVRLLVLLATAASTAHAQEAAAPEAAAAASGEADPRGRARERFVEGTTAMDEARWADAVEAFREAHALVGSPVALYNLGFALRALGRYREALEAFDALLGAGDLDEATRTDATSLRDEVRGRLATLAVEGLPAETITLTLDALDLADTGLRPLELPCDPGRHMLRIEAEGRLGFEWRGELDAGERRSVEAVLPPLPETPREAPPRSIADEPAFWVILGVVLVGAGVGAGVGGWAADEAAQLRPEATRLRL